MVDSPRDGGVLCLGVGCWGMNGGAFPAVLRLRIGGSFSVSDSSSFLGFEANIGG